MGGAEDTDSPDDRECTTQQDHLDPQDAVDNTQEVDLSPLERPAEASVEHHARGSQEEADDAGPTSAREGLRRIESDKGDSIHLNNYVALAAHAHLNEPTTVREALAADDSVEWEAAMLEELILSPSMTSGS